MRGVSMIRVTYRAHAYCLGTDGGEDGGPCPFQQRASLLVPAARVRTEAQHHARGTGHEVNVDVVDRTVYSPEPAEVSA